MSLLYILRKKCKQDNLIKVLPKHFHSSYHNCIILNPKLYLSQWQLHSLPGIKDIPPEHIYFCFCPCGAYNWFFLNT